MNKLFILIVSLFTIFQVQAQSTSNELVQDFVLYNSKPYLVSMTQQGDILKFIRKAPEILENLDPLTQKEIASYAYEDLSLPSVTYRKSIPNGNYAFVFMPFNAQLSQQNVGNLKNIANQFNEGQFSSIEIRSFITEAGNIGKKLATNRLEACKDFLTAYQVPEGSIQTSIMENYQNGAQVKIFLTSRNEDISSQ